MPFTKGWQAMRAGISPHAEYESLPEAALASNGVT